MNMTLMMDSLGLCFLPFAYMFQQLQKHEAYQLHYFAALFA